MSMNAYRSTREQALALLLESQRLVEELVKRPEHIEGSPPEWALDPLADVIGYLTPDEEDRTSNGRQLRLVPQGKDVRP